MRSTLLIILLFYLSATTCFFEDINLFTDLQTFNQFQEFVSSKDRTVCVYIFNSIDCQQCELANPIIEKFSEDMEGIIEFGLLDCDTIWEDQASRSQLELCHPKNTTNLPQLLFFQPPENRFADDRKTENSPIQHLYQGPVQLRNLSAFAKTIIPSFRTLIEDKQQLDEFLAFTAIPNKVILFTNKEETPVLFSGLTSSFRERIEFGEIRKTTKQLIKQFKIKQFPQILILKLQTDGSYLEIPYKGIIRFELIKEFISQFALERRLIKPKDRAIIREDEPPTFIELAVNEYEDKIINNENYVFLHLFKERNSQVDKLQKQILEKFEHLFDYFEFDCSVKEIAEFVEKQFDVKQFPKLIYFPNEITKNKQAKKLIFSKSESISTIMSEILHSFRQPLTQLSESNVQQFILQTMENHQTPTILTARNNNFEEIFFYSAFAHQQKWNDRLIFGISVDPTKVFKKILNIKKVPSLVSVLGRNQENYQDHQVAHFSGSWDSRAIRGFISDIYSRSLVKLPKEQKVIEITNQELMDSKCGGKYAYCFIAFFEGHERFFKRKGDKKLNSQLETLYTIESEFNSKEFSFNWIDGQCFYDVLSRLYIVNPLEEMPIFIAYNQHTNKYTYLTKEFNPANVRSFVNDVKEGKVLQWVRPKEELDFDEKDCFKFHENYVPVVKSKKKRNKKEEL